MNLKMDRRWEFFPIISNYESFVENIIPKIYLKDQVPEDIKNSYKIIEKILLHSYFEYEFFDVAATKALMTFEMALRIRYRELTGEDWEKKTKKGEAKRDLKNLITWFQDQHYFEVTNDAYLDHVRKVRNSYAHPDRHSFGGPMARHWIENPMDLINDLYEDPILREKRKLRRKELIELFSKVVNSGCSLFMNQIEYLIYDLKIVFIDNRRDSEIIYLLFHPIFTLDDLYPKEGLSSYQFIQVAANSISFDESKKEIIFIDQFEKKEILVSSVGETNSRKQLDEWILNARTINYLPHIASLDHDSTDWFLQIRRQFHKGGN